MSSRWTELAAVLFLTVAGCNRGPQIAPVSGRVTLDGKPLAAAEVKFEPQSGRASHGRTNENGEYQMRYTRDQMGALVGEHTVRILSATELTLPNGKFELRPQMVPPRYNTQTELHSQVKAGQNNRFDFDLSGKKK
jgi:hypothetical protein